MIPYPRTWVEVDLPALAHNLSLIREKIGPITKIALVAKADGYGHGLVPVARYALQHGADWIAVATVQEGIALRDVGVEAPILILSPILPVEVDQAVFYRLRFMAERIDLAIAADRAARDQQTEALLHLPVDTGLSRFGCLPEEGVELALAISKLPNVKLEGIGTHFAESGSNRCRTTQQLERFESLLKELNQAGINFDLIHTANSAGAIFYPEARMSLVRVGIAAYGVDPYEMFEGRSKPVLSWRARVMTLRDRPSGTPISYAGTYVTNRSTKIATLGVGYGDGYPRSLSNKGVVQIGDALCPVVGLVCMDQLLVDTTNAPGVAIGDEAFLIGKRVTVEHLANVAETNTHEIITRIMSRVPRRYLY